MDNTWGLQRGSRNTKPTKSLAKCAASKLRLKPAIVEFDRPQSFRAKRSRTTTKSLGGPKSRVCDSGREALRRGADVFTSQTIGTLQTDPVGPRDGSDPSFAAALTKKLSDLSVSSSRDESPSSGFFSRSSTSGDLYVLEGDEESREARTGSDLLGGDDSDVLDSLSDEEWDESDSQQRLQDSDMHHKMPLPGLPSLLAPSSADTDHKTSYRLQSFATSFEVCHPSGRSDSLSTVETADSAIFQHPSSFLTPSLFPKCPPTIHFATADEIIEFIPVATRRLMKWRMSSITPNVIKTCIKRSGFTPAKRGDVWLGYWGKHMKAAAFRSIRDYQKVNHFPGSFQIGRKDRLWRNLSRMQHRLGRTEYDFFPQTYILPYDFTQLKAEFERGGVKQKWIVKPPASARGIGVRVISKWTQVPTKRPAIVQRYIDKPFLINQSKFDLRIYVYVSSYDPLRVYVFDDGLVRFATCKYSMAAKSLSNRFMHLTNYSVNKKNSSFTPNSDETVCQGHKWGLKALWRYMRADGIDVDALWESIKDVVVKTIISSESAVSSLMKAHVHNKWSCHELFGFDIMLDERLKPWVLEVNISPSLHSNSSLDENIKGHMVRDLLNMAGFRLPSTKSTEKYHGVLPAHLKVTTCRSGGLSPDERSKHVFYVHKHLGDAEQLSVITTLTPDDLRILIETEDEFNRRGRFERVFPTSKTNRYLNFFETPRYYNVLLDQWIRHYRHCSLRGIERLVSYAQKGIHLGHTSDPEHQWTRDESQESTLTRRRVLSAPGGVILASKSHHFRSSGLGRYVLGLPGIWSSASKSRSKPVDKKQNHRNQDPHAS